MAILIIAGIAVTLGTAKLKLSLTSSHKNHFLYSPRVLTFPHGHTPRAVAHRIYFVAQTGTQGRPVHAHRAIVRRRGKSGHRARPHVFRAAEPFPYVGGHLMTVPYKEVADLHGLTDEELADLWKLTRRCLAALTAMMKPDGFNVGINLGKVAGAGIVEHLHIHIVPRWNGGTNFMPVLANTTVLPEALKEIAAKLRVELGK